MQKKSKNIIPQLLVCLLRKHTAGKDTGKLTLLSNIAFNCLNNALESLPRLNWCNIWVPTFWAGSFQRVHCSNTHYRVVTLIALAFQGITCPPPFLIRNWSAYWLVGPTWSRYSMIWPMAASHPESWWNCDGGMISISNSRWWECSTTKAIVELLVDHLR